MSDSKKSSADETVVRFGLTSKLFLLVLISFGLLISLIVFQIGAEARKAADTAIEKSLRRSESILNTRLDSRFHSIKETAGNLARDGRLLPLVYAEEALSLQDQCSEFEKSLDFDVLIFTSGAGQILARSDDPDAIGQYVDNSKLFQVALSGKEVSGFMKSGNALLQIVATPIFDNAARDVVRGVVALAYRLSEELAEEIKNLADSEIAFYAGPSPSDDDSEAHPAEIYSTFTTHQDSLQEFFSRDSEIWPRFKDSGDVQEARIQLADEIFHVLLLPLRTSDDKILGFAIALRSRTELLRPFTTIQKRVVIISISCLVIACFVSYGIARHIAMPIVGLVAVTEKIQEGEYPDQVPNERSDEVGVLYKAVYKMGRELKEKADLENYLAGLSDDLEPVDPDSATMITANMSTVNAEVDHFPEVKETYHAGKKVADRYQIDGTIGAGAMGIVYLARDLELSEPVALKMIINPGLTGEALELFKQEIRLARQITHKNVLRTHDFGTFEGFHYISMEHVLGYDLNQLVKRKGAMDFRMGIMLARQMCSAIAAAHEEGIVHRDLKPQNMMINRRGILKVMDFGIAINIKQEESEDDAKKGDVFRKDGMVGTPNFMSPEQFSNKEVDVRSDIYSVGVILYYLFTADLPFRGKTLWELATAVIKTPPPKLRSLRPDAPEALEALIDKALAKDREDRFANIQEVAQALSAITTT